MDPNLEMYHLQYNSQVEQRHLFMHYQALRNARQPLPSFRDTAFRVYSQNDEDGILLYVFSLIGFTSRLLVDIAFSSPLGSNSTNLLCNWGFWGLLVECDAACVQNSINFFASHPETVLRPPKLVKQWVAAETVNEMLAANKLTGEIDLLALDIDGVDYWLWKSLEAVQPRVVIAEAAAFLGKERAITVPYKPKFNRMEVHPNYFGASIPAMVKLGRSKGYRLVACNRFGFNLVFVRDDLGKEVLPEISVEECFRFNPPGLQEDREKKCQEVMRFPYVEV